MFRKSYKKFGSHFTIQSYQNHVEMRSDTFTLPSDECRKAAYLSHCGDNVWQTDTTTQQLEEQLASLFNHEKAMFFPSGTMANLAALMIYARHKSFIVGDQSHIYKNEQGGLSSLAGIMPRVIKNTQNGGFLLSDIRSEHSSAKNVHVVENKGIALEITHNVMNGDIPDQLEEIRQLCDEFSWKMHLDGARAFNALVQKDWEPDYLGNLFHSITVSLSKGLGAPIGSVLIGDSAFIEEARYMRKLLGGGMRQTGFIAAPALEALKTWKSRLQEDHSRARQLKDSLQTFVKTAPQITNMVKFEVEGVEARAFCDFLQTQNVYMAPVRGSEVIRACIHQNIDDHQIKQAIQAVKKGLIHFKK